MMQADIAFNFGQAGGKFRRADRLSAMHRVGTSQHPLHYV
jgi:hypothetical protein